MAKRKKRKSYQQAKDSLAETTGEAAQSRAEKDDAEYGTAKSQDEKEVAEQFMKPRRRSRQLGLWRRLRNRLHKIKEWIRGRERALSVWLPIVLTGLVIYITTLQWWSMERSIDISNRAYVNVDKMTFIFRDSQLKELRAGDFAVAGIHYINKGNSPALKMSVEASVEPLSNPISEPMETMPSSRLSQVSAVLAKDMDAYSIVKSDKPLDDAMLKALQDGRYSIYAWGTITYEDMFGKPHKTIFCFVHKPDGGVSFDVCPIHNFMN
jgi:hypothetical protein